MLRVGVCASGRGSNLEALLGAQDRGELGAEVAVVVSDVRDSGALDVARGRGVEAVFVDPEGSSRDEHDADVVDVLSRHRVGLVVLAGYMRVVGPELLGAFPDRIVNVHPSLLPAFRGLHAQQRALDAGVRFAGCTTHFVRPEVDGGPIILQAVVPVAPDDTVESLSARILEQEHRILPATVRLFADGRLSIDGDAVSIKGAEPNDHASISPGGVLP